jgi:aerobic-type carbon monoxide dehydrogenase small subunit (CoxS/CutS family)
VREKLISECLREALFQGCRTRRRRNGQPVSVDASPDTPLLWVLRDYLNLSGTKYGCGMAETGAACPR